MKAYIVPTSCYKKVLYLLFPIFLTLASFLFIYQDEIYERILYISVKPKPGTRAYHFWEITDPSPIMNIYVFNWTNADDVKDKNVIPNFEQVGPYRFRRTREKFDVVFNDNDTVTYKFKENYEFIEEGSESLYDVVTTVNPIALTAAYRARFENQFQKTLLSMGLMSIASVTMQRSVKELLFEGYEDEILDTVRPFSMVLNEKILDRFGFLTERNSSKLSSAYNVHMGANDLFGELLQYDYKYFSPFYTGDCALYHGSSSEFYPILNYKDYVELFVPEMCTAARLDYEKDVMLLGMYARKFTSEHMFDNGEFIEKNRCFCTNGMCMPNGVFNVSLCAQNTPMYISSPHFYNADPHYRTVISGMEPDKEKHEFFFIMEPNSGITFKYGIRAQINMHLKPYSGFGFFRDVPDIMVPILYLDEVAVLSDEVTSLLYILQNLPMYMMYTYIFLYSLSFIIFIFLICGFCRDCLYTKR